MDPVSLTASPTSLESCSILNAYQIYLMFAVLRAVMNGDVFCERLPQPMLFRFSIIGRLQHFLLPNSTRRSIVIVMSFESFIVGRSRIPHSDRAIGAG